MAIFALLLDKENKLVYLVELTFIYKKLSAIFI